MGFTTAQDVLFTYTMGYIFKNSHTDYRNVTSHYFPINIDAYLMVSSPEAKSSWIEVLKTKKDNFKIKGIKFILDGSIQGYTAFLNEPYEVLPHSSGDHHSDYLYAVDRNQSCYPPNCGIQSYKNQSIVNEIIATAYEHGVDVITHCNGDAAADQLIEAVKYAKNRFPNLTY
jgi:predicted amidohydrolase YtcJ